MTNAAAQSPLLSVAETAQRLRVSEKTIRRMIDRGELPALRVGAQIRIDLQELQSWLFADVERSGLGARTNPQGRASDTYDVKEAANG